MILNNFKNILLRLRKVGMIFRIGLSRNLRILWQGFRNSSKKEVEIRRKSRRNSIYEKALKRIR